MPNMYHLTSTGDECVCPTPVNVLKEERGTFLVVQCLGLHTSTAGSMGFDPGWGSKILHAVKPKTKLNKNKPLS